MELLPKRLEEYRVLVRCYTYNHSAYIKDALNGFVLQQTQFPFVIVLVDDASTDGEQDVIRQYLNEQFEVENENVACDTETTYARISYAQHRSNKNCFIAVYYLKENHYSQKKKKAPYIQPWRNICKYEAMCEGDDYWIDPLKLQKQVDFLDANPEYGLICTDINAFYQCSSEFQNDYFKNKKYLIKYTFDDFIVKAWFIAPCTWLYHCKYTKIKKNNQRFIVGDLPLLLEISALSKIKFLEDTTSVYRILEDSASHKIGFRQQIKFQKGIFDIQNYYLNKYNKLELKKTVLINYYKILMKISLKNKEIIHFVKYTYSFLKSLLTIK